MKRFWLSLPFVLAGILAIVLLRQLRTSNHELVSYRLSRQVMGTLASIEAVAPPSMRKQLPEVVSRAFTVVDRVEAIMSPYKDDSLVSRINRQAAQEPVALDGWTAEVLRQSQMHWKLSGGAFDPTCGPLIELWKRCGKEDRLPTPEEIATAKDRSGFDKVILNLEADPPTIRFTQPGMRIDLGGIAKGFAIDLAAGELHKSGCVGGLVDIGGDIRTFGRPDDDAYWQIAVQNPFHEGTLRILSVHDAAVCTSGNYQRFSIIQGHRYSHIIDPRSGMPAEASPSVTIAGANTTGTDAIATAVSVLGYADGMKMISNLPHYEAMLIIGSPQAFEMKSSVGFDKFVRN